MERSGCVIPENYNAIDEYSPPMTGPSFLANRPILFSKRVWEGDKNVRLGQAKSYTLEWPKRLYQLLKALI